MEIKDLKLIPPSKRTTAFFRNFMKEHEKGLKAIKTLAEIKEIAESCGWNFGSEILYKRIEQILQKISECEVENGHTTN